MPSVYLIDKFILKAHLLVLDAHKWHPANIQGKNNSYFDVLCIGTVNLARINRNTELFDKTLGGTITKFYLPIKIPHKEDFNMVAEGIDLLVKELLRKTKINELIFVTPEEASGLSGSHHDYKCSKWEDFKSNIVAKYNQDIEEMYNAKLKIIFTNKLPSKELLRQDTARSRLMNADNTMLGAHLDVLVANQHHPANIYSDNGYFNVLRIGKVDLRNIDRNSKLFDEPLSGPVKQFFLPAIAVKTKYNTVVRENVDFFVAELLRATQIKDLIIIAPEKPGGDQAYKGGGIIYNSDYTEWFDLKRDIETRYNGEFKVKFINEEKAEEELLKLAHPTQSTMIQNMGFIEKIDHDISLIIDEMIKSFSLLHPLVIIDSIIERKGQLSNIYEPMRALIEDVRREILHDQRDKEDRSFVPLLITYATIRFAFHGLNRLAHADISIEIIRRFVIDIMGYINKKRPNIIIRLFTIMIEKHIECCYDLLLYIFLKYPVYSEFILPYTPMIATLAHEILTKPDTELLSETQINELINHLNLPVKAKGELIRFLSALNTPIKLIDCFMQTLSGKTSWIPSDCYLIESLANVASSVFRETVAKQSISLTGTKTMDKMAKESDKQQAFEVHRIYWYKRLARESGCTTSELDSYFPCYAAESRINSIFYEFRLKINNLICYGSDIKEFTLSMREMWEEILRNDASKLHKEPNAITESRFCIDILDDKMKQSSVGDRKKVLEMFKRNLSLHNQSQEHKEKELAEYNSNIRPWIEKIVAIACQKEQHEYIIEFVNALLDKEMVYVKRKDRLFGKPKKEVAVDSRIAQALLQCRIFTSDEAYTDILAILLSIASEIISGAVVDSDSTTVTQPAVPVFTSNNSAEVNAVINDDVKNNQVMLTLAEIQSSEPLSIQEEKGKRVIATVDVGQLVENITTDTLNLSDKKISIDKQKEARIKLTNEIKRCLEKFEKSLRVEFIVSATLLAILWDIISYPFRWLYAHFTGMTTPLNTCQKETLESCRKLLSGDWCHIEEYYSVCNMYYAEHSKEKYPDAAPRFDSEFILESMEIIRNQDANISPTCYLEGLVSMKHNASQSQIVVF